MPLPHFHLTFSKTPANAPVRKDPTWVDPWPNGYWALYQITGDEIADRVVRDELVKPERGPAYYRGEVIARHSWPGFVGGYDSLEEAAAEIERLTAEWASAQ